MSNADRIGLPSFLGWLVENPQLATICALVLTPLGVFIVALVCESRLVGTHFRPFRGAFRGFMPGDIFLGAAFGQFVWQVQNFPVSDGWWTSTWWHCVVAIGAVGVGQFVRNVNDRPNYSPSAMRSPTKLYHDFVIYSGFGYVFFSTMVAGTLATGRDTSLILPYGLSLGWLACVLTDAFKPKEVLKELARNSHPDQWQPIWVTGWKFVTKK